MNAKAVYEYTGYENCRLVGVDVVVDLTEQTTNYVSYCGPCEEIVAYGTRNRYWIENVDIPDWLLTGITRGKVDGRWFNHADLREVAVLVLASRMGFRDNDWARALAPLANAKPSKFVSSLRDWFASHGMLTEQQVTAFLRYR